MGSLKKKLCADCPLTKALRCGIMNFWPAAERSRPPRANHNKARAVFPPWPEILTFKHIEDVRQVSVHALNMDFGAVHFNQLSIYDCIGEAVTDFVEDKVKAVISVFTVGVIRHDGSDQGFDGFFIKIIVNSKITLIKVSIHRNHIGLLFCCGGFLCSLQVLL